MTGRDAKPNYRPLLFGIVYFAAGIFLLIILALLEWPGVVRSCAPLFCFCVPWNEDQLFAQPVGFWTNLAYVGVGFFILWQVGRESLAPGTPLVGVTPFTVLYGFICISIGLGSMMLHGSNRPSGGSVDLITMAWFITFVFVYSLSRVLRLFVAPRVFRDFWRVEQRHLHPRSDMLTALSGVVVTRGDFLNLIRDMDK